MSGGVAGCCCAASVAPTTTARAMRPEAKTTRFIPCPFTITTESQRHSSVGHDFTAAVSSHNLAQRTLGVIFRGDRRKTTASARRRPYFMSFRFLCSAAAMVLVFSGNAFAQGTYVSASVFGDIVRSTHTEYPRSIGPVG